MNLIKCGYMDIYILIGYDHKKNKEYEKMAKKEKLILNFLNCLRK